MTWRVELGEGLEEDLRDMMEEGMVEVEEEDITVEAGGEEEVDKEGVARQMELTGLAVECKIWVLETEEGGVEEGIEEAEEVEEEGGGKMKTSLTVFELNQNTYRLKKELLVPLWLCHPTSSGLARSQTPGCSSTEWTSPWTRRGPS